MSFMPSDSKSAPLLSRLLSIIGGAPAERADPIAGLEAYLNGQGSLPRQRGLFGGDYLRYMSARDAPPQPASAPGWSAPGAELYAANSGPSLSDAVPRSSDPQAQLYRIGAPPRQVTEMAARPAAAAPASPVEPSRTDVFQPGQDGKLHPIPGWHTTGPLDFGQWAHNIDWPGVGWDLATDALGAFGAGFEGPLTAWKAAQLASRLATPAVGIEKSVHEKMKRERGR